eukprot:scaffold489_cov259-Pinguiococcus_pyrenoidosus.AAC.39
MQGRSPRSLRSWSVHASLVEEVQSWPAVEHLPAHAERKDLLQVVFQGRLSAELRRDGLPKTP